VDEGRATLIREREAVKSLFAGERLMG
jgi:hypothetical protein